MLLGVVNKMPLNRGSWDQKWYEVYGAVNPGFPWHQSTHIPFAKASDINVHDRGPWGRGPLIV